MDKMERKRQIENLKRLCNLNKEGIVETPETQKILSFESPEEKQLKNIAIALKGIQKELEHLNRTMRK